MAKVSVVIPTYNRAEMIEETVESVLVQSLNDVEIIVVDDGSTDGTNRILKKFSNHIKYYNQKNQGRSVARNRGIRNSTGEYLVLLDSDDLFMPDGLQAMTTFLDENPKVDIVYADGYYCDKNGKNIELVSEGRPPVNLDAILETLVKHNIIGAPHLAMVRRRALQNLGAPYFDETLRGTEDLDFWIRLAAQGSQFASINAIVGKYRLHGSNASQKGSPNWERRWQSYLRGRRKILNSNYFAGLSVTTRYQFIYKLLLNDVQDDIEAQEEILQSSAIQALPPLVQAKIFYYVGVDNIVQNAELMPGKARLQHAVALAPQQTQYRVIAFLSRIGITPVRIVVAFRRSLAKLSRKKQVDRSVAPHGRPGWQA